VWTFRNNIRFCGEEFLAPRPTPTLGHQLLSVVRDCLFNIFAATPILEAVPPSTPWGRAMQWWQGPTYHSHNSSPNFLPQLLTVSANLRERAWALTLYVHFLTYSQDTKLMQPNGGKICCSVSAPSLLNSLSPNGALRCLQQQFYTFKFRLPDLNSHFISSADPSDRAVYGVSLRPIACWECGFESGRGHGYMFVISVLTGTRPCEWLITRPKKSYWVWSVLSAIVTPQQWDSGSLGAAASWRGKKTFLSHGTSTENQANFLTL
jgi:hypothetical protein